MPEILEVRRYADLLKKYLVNNKINKIKILNGRYKKHGPFPGYNILQKLVKRKIKVTKVKTKGKIIIIYLENDNYIINNLGLTGGWCYYDITKKKYIMSTNTRYYSKYQDQDVVSSYTNSALLHLNLSITLDDGIIYFHDIISYGRLNFINGISELHKILDKIGPDIMDKSTNYSIFSDRIRRYDNKTIANVLVNQKILSGIGNYLRSEILYMSKISPFRKVSNINSKELKKLFLVCKRLTVGIYNKKLAIKLKYLKSNTKLPKDYGRIFFVYRQEYDINNYKVRQKKIYEGSEKKTIYYVPEIQK